MSITLDENNILVRGEMESGGPYSILHKSGTPGTDDYEEYIALYHPNLWDAMQLLSDVNTERIKKGLPMWDFEELRADQLAKQKHESKL